MRKLSTVAPLDNKITVRVIMVCPIYLVISPRYRVNTPIANAPKTPTQFQASNVDDAPLSFGLLPLFTSDEPPTGFDVEFPFWAPQVPTIDDMSVDASIVCALEPQLA